MSEPVTGGERNTEGERKETEKERKEREMAWKDALPSEWLTQGHVDKDLGFSSLLPQLSLPELQRYIE